MKFAKQSIIVFLVNATLIVGCENHVSYLEIIPDEVKIYDNEGRTELLAIASNTSGIEMSDVDVSWSSSAPEIVEVDGFGNLTAKRSGKAVVTATVDNLTESVEVLVSLCTSLVAEQNVLTLTIGQSGSVHVEAFNERGDRTPCPLRFAVNNDSIARVSRNGAVTGLIPGATTLTVSSGETSVEIDINVVTNPSLIEGT